MDTKSGTTIYGASDDLIELEGGLRGEYNFYSRDDDQEEVLALSDGTLLSIIYNGQWKFGVLVRGNLYDHTEEATDEEKNYSDHVFFLPGLTWAVVGVRVKN
jgi:hypothetical protein